MLAHEHDFQSNILWYWMSISSSCSLQLCILEPILAVRVFEGTKSQNIDFLSLHMYESSLHFVLTPSLIMQIRDFMLFCVYICWQ